ncbi:type II toxin-antitoxin system RelE/ParE family toxin [bacterium]|nr:type II toxin-antitoxin system RelE/ParE family toxin [bacterium]
MSGKRYKVELSKRVRKDARRIPTEHRKRIRLALRRLEVDPRGPGTSVLRGRLAGLTRCRVGDYRIVYRIHDARLHVYVIRMGSRQYIYQSLLRFLSTLT